MCILYLSVSILLHCTVYIYYSVSLRMLPVLWATMLQVQFLMRWFSFFFLYEQFFQPHCGPGLTHLLTEMSTWNLPGGKGRQLSNDINLTAISKPWFSGLNTFLGLHSWKPVWKEIRNRRHSVNSTPCQCGRSYIDETDKPLAVWLREHRHNLKEGLLEKSKLAQFGCWKQQQV
jgi:hypothetical protein